MERELADIKALGTHKRLLLKQTQKYKNKSKILKIKCEKRRTASCIFLIIGANKKKKSPVFGMVNIFLCKEEQKYVKLF